MRVDKKIEAYDLSKNALLVDLFPSPMMRFDWPESEAFNHLLKQIILEMQTHSAGVVKTNRGGWQSEANLPDWQYAEIRRLIDRICQLAQEYVARITGKRDSRFETGWMIRAWANVNGRGHFNRTHNHLGRNSFFSGVYYVDVGDIKEDDATNGCTVFENWSRVATSILDDPNLLHADFKITPRNGRMLLFPASLMHSVEVYDGERPRITIAFNLYHPGFAIPRLSEYERSAGWMWTNFRGLMMLKRKIPEKLLGLALIPRTIASRPLPKPISLGGLRAHFFTAVDHAFALASERFEVRGKT